MSGGHISSAETKEDNLKAGARGGLIAYSLQIIAAGLGFLNTVVFARILGAGGVGEYFLAIAVINIAALFAGFGMQGAMMRFIPSYIENNELSKLKGVVLFVLKFCFLLSIVLTFLIILLSKFIAINLYNSPGLFGILPLVALVLPIYVLNEIIGGVLRGHKDTLKALLPSSLISPFFRLSIFLLLSLDGMSTLHAVFAFIAGEVIAFILSAVFLFNKLAKTKPSNVRDEYRKILNVASTMIFTTISVFLFTQADLMVVGMYTSAEDVGVYGVVARLVTLIAFSLGAFSAIIPPIISSVHTAGDHEELERVVRESTRWILTIAMPIILIFLFEGKYILTIAYGDIFVKGFMALIILSVGQLINAGSGLVGYLLQMTGNHMAFMKITFFWGVTNIILNFLLIPKFGILGAAVSTAFCLSMVNIVSIYVVYKKMSILTIARGLKFDLIFSLTVMGLYLLLNYRGVAGGHHVLLAAALIIYIGRAIMNDDLPWRIILAKNKA